MDLLTEFCKSPDAKCPGCGYSLTGLTTGVCPECGVALRLELGGFPRWLRRLPVIALATFLLYHTLAIGFMAPDMSHYLILLVAGQPGTWPMGGTYHIVELGYELAAWTAAAIGLRMWWKRRSDAWLMAYAMWYAIISTPWPIVWWACRLAFL